MHRHELPVHRPALAELEVHAVARLQIGEGLGIGVLGLGTEQPRLLPIPGDTLAPQVAKVGGKRRGPRAMTDDARLDHGVARSVGEQSIGLDGRSLAAPETRAVARADLAGARDPAAGTLGGGEGRLGGAWASYAEISVRRLVNRDGTGQITTVSTPYLNLGAVKTDGIEAQIHWGLPARFLSESGKVYVDSVVGKGTTVTCEFPADQTFRHAAE